MAYISLNMDVGAKIVWIVRIMIIYTYLQPWSTLNLARFVLIFDLRGKWPFNFYSKTDQVSYFCKAETWL